MRASSEELARRSFVYLETKSSGLIFPVEEVKEEERLVFGSEPLCALISKGGESSCFFRFSVKSEALCYVLDWINMMCIKLFVPAADLITIVHT